MVTKADMRMCPYCAVLKRPHASPKTQVARIRFSLHKKQRADRARGRSVLSHSGNMLRVAGHMEESVPPNHGGLRAKSRQRLRLRREDSHLPGLPVGHARAPFFRHVCLEDIPCQGLDQGSDVPGINWLPGLGFARGPVDGLHRRGWRRAASCVQGGCSLGGHETESECCGTAL